MIRLRKGNNKQKFSFLKKKSFNVELPKEGTIKVPFNYKTVSANNKSEIYSAIGIIAVALFVIFVFQTITSYL